MSSSDNLVLYLKMDEIAIQDDGSVKVPDTSGAGNNGLVQGNVSLVADDTFGSVLSFDGNSSYLAVENFTYSAANSVPAITVIAWVKTSVANQAVIASWDRSEFWRLAVGNDQNQTQKRVFWATSTPSNQAHDSYGDTDVADDEWHFIAVTYDSVAGAKSIYVDGVLDGTLEIITTNESLGYQDVTRYGFIGVGSEADSFDGTKSPADYFSGRMAHFRIYERALTVDEIGDLMADDQLAISSFEATHPLAFELYDEDEQPALYIDTDPSNYTLTLAIENTADQTILFPTSEAPVSTAAYHLELRFPPGTLDDPSNITLAEMATWEMAWSQSNGVDTLYLMCFDPGTFFANNDGNGTGLLTADETFTLTLKQITAAAAGGARGTRVELRPGQIAYDGQSTDLSGSRIQTLQVLSHRGKKDIPLHFGVVGDNTVLNNGSTDNTLTLRLTNLSRGEAITLDESSTFIVALEAGSTDEEWTLGTSTEVGTITGELMYVAGQTVSIDLSQPGGGEANIYAWELAQTDLGISELPAGEYIDVKLTNIATNHPPGQTKVIVYYDNIPGYWDGQLISLIQRAPLLFSGTSVGIGTTDPQTTLDVNGTIRFVDQLQTTSIAKITPIYIRGTAKNNTGVTRRKLVIGGTTVYNVGGIGLALTIIDKASQAVVSTQIYNTWNNANAADELATALNNIDKEQLGVLSSYDAWESKVNDNLKSAFQRVGLYKALAMSGWRHPYAAIFEAASATDIGTAKAVEVMLHSNDSDTPFAEIRGWLMDGSFVTTGTIPNALAKPDGASPAMLVNQSGYIGVGTTEAPQPLTVNGKVQSGTSTSGAYPSWIDNDNTLGIFVREGAGNAFFGLKNRSGASGGSNDYDTVLYWGDDTADDLVFEHQDQGEVMRLSGDGYLSLHNGTNGDLLYFNTERAWKFTTSGTGSDTALHLQSTVNSKNFKVVSKEGTVALNVYASDEKGIVTIPGDLTVTGILQTKRFAFLSDLRFKTDMQPITAALEKVMNLAGLTYRWNETGLDYLNGESAADLSAVEKEQRLAELAETHIGFVAQEVEAVIPEVVRTNQAGYKSVLYPNLVALLVEAIKEQHQRIESLSSRVAALES